MAAFNLTAEINLRGPSNLNRVVSDIRRQLSTVSLNLNINPNASRGIQTATSNIRALNAALQNANTSAATLNATLRSLGSALGSAAGATNTLNNGLNNISQQVTRTQRTTQQAALTMEDFGRQSALAVRRFAAFSVSAGAIYTLTRAISSAYNEFISFNKELVRLQQVTGTTANGLKGITDEITRLSTGLGVTSADLLTVSSTLAQAGLSATETKKALEALAKSALAPSFDNLNDTVEGSIALMRQFGISANDLESSLGSVNAVAAAFAVESGDIIKAIQRTGGVFAAASKGVSQGKDALNEFIALFTSVRQTTRESAETIATGLRTIFTRIQRGGTIQALKEYGVVLTDLENKFVGPYEAIRRLSEGLKSLDPRDLRFNQIVEELGGFRQIGKVIPLIQQFTVAQQALGVAQRGAGSLAEDAGIAQLSLANKITKVREEFIALIRDIGQSKSFQTFADVSLKLASALISVASSAKEVLPALTALAAIRAIPAIGQFVGGFGRGFTRRNKGGPIRAFARGGYVPGSGDRDTVPAMLTPGEFVIRKKAVAAIGVDRLQKMNKYASGGPVKLKDLEARSGASTIKKAYNERVQPSDKISATINRKSQEVKPNDPKWMSVQNFARSRYAQLKKQNPRASDKKLKDIAAGDAFEESVAKSTGGQKTPQSYPVDIIGKKNAIEAKFTTKKTPIIDLISKLFRYRYEQNTLGRYGFTPGVDSVNIGSLDVMEMGSGQKKQFMKNYPFNMGGIVQRFAKGKGVKKLSPGLEKQVAAAGGFENLLTKNMIDSGGVYNFGLVSLKSGTSKGSRIENRPIGKTGKRARIHVGTLSDRSQYDDIESNIVSSLQGVITQTGSSLAGFLGSSIIGGKQGKQILNGAVLSSATGSIFEAALQMIGAPYIDKIESLKSMDFPFGLGKASSLFGSIPSNVPTDATRTIGGTGKGISDFVNQIGRFLGAVDKKEFTKQLGSPAPNVFRALSQGGFSGQKAQRLNKLLQSNGIMVSVGSKPLKAAGKSQLQKGLTGSSPQLQQQILDEIASTYAKGGSIQDTVPALLTPGEFVINKKAAKRIGSAKLNKLNKADKIRGFNKGGAVGTIQSFAGGGGVQQFVVGGIVSAMTSLVKSLPQLASAVVNSVNRMRGIPRNIPQGGGWTTARGRAAPLPGRGGEGGGMASMGLVFIGPMIAEAINSSISKNFGKGGAVAGSAISSAISGAAIGSALPLGPYSALIGAAVGLAAGLLDATSAANEYTKEQNELTIENRASQLDKTFEKLSNQASLTAADLNSLGDNLNYIISLGSQNQKIVEQEAGGGFMGATTRYLSQSNAASLIDSLFGTQIVEKGAGLDTEKLSRDILANTRTSTAYIQRTIGLGLEKGLKFDQIRQETRLGREEISGFSGGEGLPKLTEFDRLLALSSDRALEIAKVEADIVSARLSGVETLTLEKTRAVLIRAASDAMKELYSSTSQADQAIKAVVSQMELFAESSKNLSAIISRANAEFEESSRVRDIMTGPGFGEATIAGPSRLNENVLSNMRAYSQQEVLSTIDTLSKNLGLDPEFTTQAKTSAVAQQTLERDLPKILLEAAQKQATGKFDEGTVRDEIKAVFEPIKQLLGDEINSDQLSETINTISERLEKEVGSLQGKSFQEIVGSIPEFAQILEPLSRPVGVLQEAAKSFNDVIANTNNALNEYSSHIARITDLQNQAVSIQLEGANSLRQALGEYVSVGDLNRPFETTIDRLTSTRGPNGLIVPGTGTLDPDEIARRLAQANKELTDLNLQQQPADPKKAQEFADRLKNAKTAVDRLSLAQQKLANDTTRASNALNRVRDLVQVREARRGGAEEILKNINNPEFMMNFARDFGSYERVVGGGGTRLDIPAAIDMFNKRLQMIDPALREDESRKFYQKIEEIMTRDVRRGGLGADPVEVEKFLEPFIIAAGKDNEIKSAIDEYNKAISTQATATENMSKQMIASSETFYNKVIQAGIDFYNMISGMRPGGWGVDANPNPIIPNTASNGGLIYANKGRLVNFQPRGTDTVPAMLTPGEFVVNAKATKKNMGLLKAINSGGGTKFSRGGMVYLQGGGLVTPEMRAILQDLYESPEIVTSSADLGRTLSEVLETDGEAGLYNELKKHRGQPYGASGPQSDLLYDFITRYENKQREVEKEKLSIKQNEELNSMAKKFGYDNAQQMRETQAQFQKQQIQEFLAAQELSFQDFDSSNNINVAQDRLAELRSGNVAQLTSLEQDMFNKFKIDQQSKERQKKIQEEYNKNMEIVQAAKSQMDAQKQLDDMAKKEINPYTGKPFANAAEKEGIIARQAFEAQQKALADAKAQERLQKNQEVNAGLETFIPKLLRQYQSSKYYTQTSDPFLRELVETDLTAKSPKILAQYLELQKLDEGKMLQKDPGLEQRWFDARLEEVVSSAKLDYYAKGRRRQEDTARSEQEFANKNREIALQQFDEGVDKSPILAAVAAVPRNVPNVLRTVVGGAGVAAGGLTYAAGQLTGSDFVTELGKGLMDSGAAQAGIGVEGMRQVGAGLGSRLGLGEAYSIAEKDAMQKREALIAQQAAKASGAYRTDQTTTLGQLLTPENVVRGSIATSDIVGEAAGDFVGVGGTLNRLSAKVLSGGAKQVGKRSLSLGQRLARTNADMAKPRIMSPQDIADAEAAEAIINGISTGSRFVGKGILKGADLAETGLMNARDLTTRAIGSGARAVGRGILKGSDLVETGLMNARGLATKGIIEGTKAAGTGVLKRLGFFKDPDYYKLQQIKTAKAQRTAQKAAKKAKTTPQKKFKPQEESFDLGDDVAEEVNKVFFEGKFITEDEYSKILRAKQLQEQAQNMVVKGTAPLKVTGTSSKKGIAKIQEGINNAKERAVSILARYGSPEKLKEIMEKQDEIFAIKGVDVDTNLQSKVNVITGKKGGVGGEYRPAEEIIGLPSVEDYTKSGILLHEIFHAMQKNVGRMKGGKNIYKFFKPDSFKELQPQIEEFVKPGGAYERLIKETRGSVGGAGFYPAKDIANNHHELLTTLGTAADTKAFKNNKEAQDMLRAVIKAMGYKKGGVVYASQGTLVPYQPKGTDTVPAMLTPGEFVVNAKATKKNLGLLKAINGGAKGYSKGGVAYLQDGGVANTIPDNIKTLLESIKTNKDNLLNTNQVEEALRAIETIQSDINSLISSGYTLDSTNIGSVLTATQDNVLQTIKDNALEIESFYNTISAGIAGQTPNAPQAPQPPTQPQPPLYGPALPPVPPSKDELADIASFVGGGLEQLRLPASGAEAPKEDPYAGMNQRQRMLAMRKAEYEASQQAKREAFRTRTGRDPKTGRIGGAKVELTPEQKAQNKRRAEIRATREALRAKAAWVYDEETKDWKYTLTDEESDRLASAKVEFEKSLSPEQMKNRKRAERLASMARGSGGYYGDTEENRSFGLENKPYGALRQQAEFVAELSPDQIANREKAEKLALLNLQERSAEQQEKLDILRTPINERTPEQISRLEELRRERSKAIYASKGRLINFQPRGSDTVPAMLTPGEFVVNKKATKRNLGLLQQINSQRFNNGGIVMQNPQYLDVGGKAKGASGSTFGGVLPIDTSGLSSSFSDFGSYVGDLSSSIGQFSNIASSISGAFSGLDNVVSAFTALSAVSSLLSGTATGLGSAIGTFNTAVGQLGTVLGTIPDSINLNVSGSIPVDVNVTVNGGEGLDQKLDTFKDQIYNEISAQVTSQTNGKFKLNLTTSKR